FFFQAEDGIRDKLVTGVQTCALPIYGPPHARRARGRAGAVGRRRGPPDVCPGGRRRLELRAPGAGAQPPRGPPPLCPRCPPGPEIGRASCRERVYCWGVAVTMQGK